MRRGTSIFGLMTLAVVLAATPALADVVINEIMYNSSFVPDVEYIEIYNTGPTSANLFDWYLLDSDPLHPRCYLEGVLGVDEYLVIAADNTIFTVQYPGVTNYNVNDFDPGGLGFGLSNGGDEVNLFDDDDVLRDFVEYDDASPWPTSPDGSGPSLELLNPLMDNALASSWAASVPVGGTPGVVNSTFTTNAAPGCQDGGRDVRLPTAADDVTVTVTAFDEEGFLATVELLVNLGGGYVSQPMFDDGAHGDGAAADSVYGAVIPAQPNGTLVKYYALATDNIAQTSTWPSDAPTGYRAYTVGHERPLLVINEIIASNSTGITDEMGEFEDWIEIYNPGTGTVDLAGMFLTDNFDDRHEWEIPAGYSLAPGEFLVVWADNDLGDGPLHASFKLSSGGEEVGLYDTEDLGNAKIHGFKYGLVAADIAIGFLPDLGSGRDAHFSFGYSPEYLSTPTPGASNGTSALYSDVCINEFHTTSVDTSAVDDWVELYNRGASTVDIGGMFLSDNRGSNLKYMIPGGTLLAAAEFLVYDEVTLGFSFSSSGEVIMFTAADSTSGLDFYDFAEQLPDVSEGRINDGESRWDKMVNPTPGAPNEGPTGIEDETLDTVMDALYGVRVVPNPFNPRTEIHFSLGQADDVTVSVYDVAGHLVRTLHRGHLPSGEHALRWDGNDDRGRELASGVYFTRIATRSATSGQKKMLLLK
jgi:hypothetical protein